MKHEMMSLDTHHLLMNDQAHARANERARHEMELRGAEKRGELNFYEYLICSSMSIQAKEEIMSLWKARHGDNARVPTNPATYLQKGEAI